MKKVFVHAYLNNNLGDDLFLKILSERYDNSFILYCDPKKKYNGKFKNLKHNKSQLLYYFNKIIEKTIDINIHKSLIIRNSSIVLTIGGSMFIDKKNNIKMLKRKFDLYRFNKPNYILGINFGPYYSNQYKDYIENNIFKRASDICFRDKYSYSLFDNNKNTRYAPDIVFSLNKDDIEITNEKTAIVSVIDCKKRFEKNISDNYEDKIIELIYQLYVKKYRIILMSFCKDEGDEKAINSILNKINDDNLKKIIKCYFYEGNINEALNVIGKSQIIVASRFHAVILGLVMGKTVLPFVYSDKTLNVLNDIGFNGRIFDIRELEKNTIKKISDKDLNYKLDIEKYRIESIKHFEKLDLVLKKRKKSCDINEYE